MYANIHSSILNSAPIIRFQIDPKKSIFHQVRSVLLQNTSSQEETQKLLNFPLNIRSGHNHLNDAHFTAHNLLHPTIDSLNTPPHKELNLLAEHDPDEFYNHYHSLRLFTPTSKHVDQFKKWSAEHVDKGHFLDVWKHPSPGEFADILVQKNILPSQSETGLIVEKHQESLRSRVMNTKVSGGPNFHDKFHQYHEINRFVNEIKSKCNELPQMDARIFTIGKSRNNKDIIGITIKKENPNLSFRPKIVLMSGIHAREWSGISTNLYQLERMVDENDLEMQDILSKCEILLIPVLNPDGYEVSWNKGLRLWRKNVNNYSPEISCVSGVDINRNFISPHECKVNHTAPSEDDYAGPHSNSEPETRSIMDFITKASENGQILLTIDHHSYAGCLAFPFGFSKEKPDDYDVVEKCVNAGAKAIYDVNGTKYKTGQISHVIYQCSGTLLDYLKFYDVSEFSMVNELNGKFGFFSTEGFLTKPENIIKLGKENYKGLKAMISFALTKGKSKPRFKVALEKPVPWGNLPGNNGSMEHKTIGIKNRGNTCFINSSIQCFGAIRKLQNALQSAKSTNGFPNLMRQLIGGFWVENDTKKDLKQLGRVMDELIECTYRREEFERFKMEDAGKFSLMCAEELTQLVPNVFEGKLVNIIGKDCNQEEFHHVAVPVENSNNLKKSLMNYFKDEQLGNGLLKRVKITKFPELLMMTMVRPKKGEGKEFKVQKSIDLGPFGDELSKCRKSCYDLKALVNFEGTDNYGHYTATIKSSNGNWFKISDENVGKPLKMDEEIDGSKAYLLFFEKNDKKQIYENILLY